jgi:hypothetical protein
VGAKEANNQEKWGFMQGGLRAKWVIIEGFVHLDGKTFSPNGAKDKWEEMGFDTQVVNFSGYYDDIEHWLDRINGRRGWTRERRGLDWAHKSNSERKI